MALPAECAEPSALLNFFIATAYKPDEIQIRWQIGSTLRLSLISTFELFNCSDHRSHSVFYIIMGAFLSHAPLLPRGVPPGSTGQSLDRGFHQVAHYTNPVVAGMDEVLKKKKAELKSLISLFEKKEKVYAHTVTDLANRAKDAQNRQLEVMYVIGCVTDWSPTEGKLAIKQQLESLDQKPYEYAELATTIASAVISIVAMFVPGGAVVAIVVPMIGAVISDGIEIKEVNDRIDQVNADKKKLDDKIASHAEEITSLNSQIDKLNTDLDAFDRKAFEILKVKSWEDFRNNETYSGIFKADVTDMKAISTAEDASKAAAAIGNTEERSAFKKLFDAKSTLASQIGNINASIREASSATPQPLMFVGNFESVSPGGLANTSDDVAAEQNKIINDKVKAAILTVFNVSRPLSVAIISAGEILRMLAVSNSTVSAFTLESAQDAMIALIFRMKTHYDSFLHNWARVAGQGYSKMYNELETLEKACASIKEEFDEPRLELLHFLLATKSSWGWDEKTSVALEHNLEIAGSGANKSEVENVINQAVPQLDSDMRVLMAGIVTDSVPLPEQIMAMS